MIGNWTIVLNCNRQFANLSYRGSRSLDLHLLNSQLWLDTHGGGCELIVGVVQMNQHVMILTTFIQLPCIGGLQLAGEIHLVVSIG